MEEKAVSHLGWNGAMISGSKSGYVDRHPGHIAIFNSNVIVMTDEPQKIWYGDLDITLSIDKLKALAVDLGVELRVLTESDARFENEKNPKVGRFVIKVSPDGSHELGEFYSTYYSSTTLLRSENEEDSI